MRIMNVISTMIAVMLVTNRDAVRTFTISFTFNIYDLTEGYNLTNKDLSGFLFNRMQK